MPNIDPNNAPIKGDILSAINRRKKEVVELEDRLDGLSSVADDDKQRFLGFAFSFIADMGHNFLDTEVVSKPNRLRCKLLIFPDGFFWDLKNKVYTPQISPLITLISTKKSAVGAPKTQMVRQVDCCWNHFAFSLYLMHEKLVKLGVVLVDGNVWYAESQEDRNV